MIIVKEFNVQNYKSLVKTSIGINERLTALIGINGSGKTNILRAMLLLKDIVTGSGGHSRYGLSTDALPHSTINITFDIDGTTCSFKANVYFDNIDGDYEVRGSEIEMKVEEDGWLKLNPNVFDYIEYMTARRKRPGTIDKSFLTESEDVNEVIMKLAPYLSNLSYYSATQFSDPSKSPVSFELEEKRLLRSSSRTRNHERFLYDLYRTKKDNLKAYKRYLNTVNSVGVGLVSEIEFTEMKVPNSSIRVIAGGQAKKISTEKTFVIPVFTIDDLQLSPTQLSEGTFKTLALIFYILNDNADLLLIEEPEVCVHHGLLSSIVELIKVQSRTKQIIISTHSDHVLDRLAPENIVLVKKTSEGTVAAKLSKALSDDDYKALKEYLDETGNLGEYWKESGFFNE